MFSIFLQAAMRRGTSNTLNPRTLSSRLAVKHRIDKGTWEFPKIGTQI